MARFCGLQWSLWATCTPELCSTALTGKTRDKYVMYKDDYWLDTSLSSIPQMAADSQGYTRGKTTNLGTHSRSLPPWLSRDTQPVLTPMAVQGHTAGSHLHSHPGTHSQILT